MQNCTECGGKKWYAKINKKTGLQEKHVVKGDEGYEREIRIWRCYRCGHVQEEVAPPIPKHKRIGANILYFDLEVSKSMVYNYGLKVPSRYIHPDNIVHEYYIICWAASYLGNGKVWSGCVTSEQAVNWNEKEILKPLHDLMSSADVLAGHNVDAYDMKRANTRFLLNGLEPIIGKKTIDTLKVARQKFAFESNRLDYISQRLGFRPKDDIRDSDWQKIVRQGDKKTLQKVNKYCQGDVVNGKKILKTLLDYSGKRFGYGSVTLDAMPKWLKA